MRLTIDGRDPYSGRTLPRIFLWSKNKEDCLGSACHGDKVVEVKNEGKK